MTYLILWQRPIRDFFTSCSCAVVIKCPRCIARSKEWQILSISHLCLCVGVYTGNNCIWVCATLPAVSGNMPGITQHWSAASQTKDSINQLINQILSRLSLLKCAVAHRSPDVYLGTYVISQGCVVDICFSRLRDLRHYRKNNPANCLP